MQEYSKDKVNRVKRGANRALYDVETIHKILDAGFVGYVGYVYDGYPITIPMAYARKGHKIYLHGSTANRMLLALLETEKVSMTVMHLDALVLARSGLHHSVNYRSATLFGNLQKVEDNQEKKDILEHVVNHMVEDRWDSLRTITEKELDRTLVAEFTIEKASAKVRDVGVKDEPEDYKENIWAGLVPIKQVAEYPVADEGIPQKMPIPQHVLDYYEQNK